MLEPIVPTIPVLDAPGIPGAEDPSLIVRKLLGEPGTILWRIAPRGSSTHFYACIRNSHLESVSIEMIIARPARLTFRYI